MDRQVFRGVLLAFLREANPGTYIDRLDDDDDLVELGYIDSLRAIELIEILEETFGISIPIESIDPRALHTVGGVYGMVALHQDTE
jgi:acyl carrier protein